MKRLVKRSRPDALENDIMSGRRTLGRYVYFAVLFIFLGSLFHFFFGEYYYFQAKGVVNRERNMIDAPSTIVITQTDLLPGHKVAKGDELFEFIVIEDGDISGDIELEQLSPTGFKNGYVQISQNRLEQRHGNCTDDREDLCTSPLSENPLVSTIPGDAKYGIATALVDGFVGENYPSQRQIFLPGELITDVHHGNAFVYVYAPKNYRWSIDLGDKFVVKFGKIKANATTVEFLPVSLVPPAEFHNSIKAAGRNRIMVLKMEENIDFPNLQEVDIRRGSTFFN